jgi:hypothetical protein
LVSPAGALVCAKAELQITSQRSVRVVSIDFMLLDWLIRLGSRRLFYCQTFFA